MFCDLIVNFSLASFRQKKFFHIFAPDAEAVDGDASDDFIVTDFMDK
jgi:hypothetical protein